MTRAARVVLLTLAASVLQTSTAAAQTPDVSGATADALQAHRIRPALAVGLGYQPQATLDHRLGGRADEIAGAFTYDIAADIDIMPALRLGIHVVHTPWETLHSVALPFEDPVDRGGMTLVSASVAGRLMLGTAVPLWLHFGAGGFRYTQDARPATDDQGSSQRGISTVDQAVNLAAYFDFDTRWDAITFRGGADDTYVFFGEESGLEASHLIAVRLALAYRF